MLGWRFFTWGRQFNAWILCKNLFLGDPMIVRKWLSNRHEQHPCHCRLGMSDDVVVAIARVDMSQKLLEKECKKKASFRSYAILDYNESTRRQAPTPPIQRFLHHLASQHPILSLKNCSTEWPPSYNRRSQTNLTHQKMLLRKVSPNRCSELMNLRKHVKP